MVLVTLLQFAPRPAHPQPVPSVRQLLSLSWQKVRPRFAFSGEQKPYSGTAGCARNSYGNGQRSYNRDFGPGVFRGWNLTDGLRTLVLVLYICDIAKPRRLNSRRGGKTAVDKARLQRRTVRLNAYTADFSSKYEDTINT